MCHTNAYFTSISKLKPNHIFTRTQNYVTGFPRDRLSYKLSIRFMSQHTDVLQVYSFNFEPSQK